MFHFVDGVSLVALVILVVAGGGERGGAGGRHRVARFALRVQARRHPQQCLPDERAAGAAGGGPVPRPEGASRGAARGLVAADRDPLRDPDPDPLHLPAPARTRGGRGPGGVGPGAGRGAAPLRLPRGRGPRGPARRDAAGRGSVRAARARAHTPRTRPVRVLERLDGHARLHRPGGEPRQQGDAPRARCRLPSSRARRWRCRTASPWIRRATWWL